MFAEPLYHMGEEGAWLAQSVGHVSLDLEVMNLNPILGIEIS